MDSHIASIREEYLLKSFTEQDADKNPFLQFKKWFAEAEKSSLTEVNAMTLCTVDKQNTPQGRIVLLKGIEGKQFIFFTNYNSQKAKDIEHNPEVVLVFHWRELQRQVRIKGKARKISEQASEEYFHSRPLESQIGAWASHQSEVLASREELELRYETLKKQFEGKTIPKPDFWGGYGIQPEYLEFWQGRASRLHDRICYRKANEEWQMQRLNP